MAADYGPGSRVCSIASATPTGLILRAANYPPEKSQYNPIEHPLFSEISENGAGAHCSVGNSSSTSTSQLPPTPVSLSRPTALGGLPHWHLDHTLPQLAGTNLAKNEHVTGWKYTTSTIPNQEVILSPNSDAKQALRRIRPRHCRPPRSTASRRLRGIARTSACTANATWKSGIPGNHPSVESPIYESLCPTSVALEVVEKKGLTGLPLSDSVIENRKCLILNTHDRLLDHPAGMKR